MHCCYTKFFLYTVPAPTAIKDAASIKRFFYPMHYGAFHRISSIFTTNSCTKFSKTHLVCAISKGAGTIQERPLLVWLRHFKIILKSIKVFNIVHF